MRITNNYNLPGPLADWAKGGSPLNWLDHQIRVTQLIRPPQMLRLEYDHWSTLTADASDFLWAIMGTNLHRNLETGHKSEVPLMTEVFGWTLTGTADRIDNGVLSDWKLTSAYKVEQGVPPDWELQLNLYAWLAERQGIPVGSLVIYALLRDHKGMGRFRDTSGPIPYREMNVPLWPPEEVESIIDERLEAIETAFTQSGPRPCTDEERWAQASVWAVHKPGRKSALKLAQSEEQARAWIDECYNGSSTTLTIEHRPGAYRRCERYCPVREVCPQHNA